MGSHRSILALVLLSCLAGGSAARAEGLPEKSTLKPGSLQRDDAGNIVVDEDPADGAHGFREGRIKRDDKGDIVLDTASTGALIRLCLEEAWTADCTHRSLSKALADAADHSVIEIAAGTYHDAGVLEADNVVIRAAPGAHLQGVAARGKAALVIKGDNTTVEGLECSGIEVPDGNGACIRLHGSDLTLRRVNFHDSQEGLLASRNTGHIVIEDSTFERLGHGGRAHGVYVNQGTTLEIRRSRFLSSKGEGHAIKSRARKTLVEDSVVASLYGVDSYLIDTPNGGEVVIRNNVLQEGPNSANWTLFAFGRGGVKYPDSHALIEGNTIIIDTTRAVLFKARDMQVTFSGNVFVGDIDVPPNNKRYADRSEANLAPAPALPSEPLE